MRKYYTEMLVPFLVGFLLSILFTSLCHPLMLGEDAVIIRGGLYNREVLMSLGNVSINRLGLFFFALKHRLTLYFVMLIMTLMKRKEIKGGMLAYIGICIGVSLTAMIARIGMWGILLFVVALFPQGLFYILAYGMLIQHMGTDLNTKGLGFMSVFVGVLLVITGCFLESYVNSFLVSKFLKIYIS